MYPRKRCNSIICLAALLCLLRPSISSEAKLDAGYAVEAELDRVRFLPGWGKPGFPLFSGYITVSEDHGRALFYVFAQAQKVDPLTAPVVLWLNGGPGCSSLGGGFMSELGPFYPSKNGHYLEANPFSWNHKANIIFLESPAFVGFSYSNTSSDIETGDKQTAVDSHEFLKQFFKRYPNFASSPFWLAGESYAGHYLPQLAYEIVSAPNNSIPFQGFMLGNPLTDPYIDSYGALHSWFAHGMISDDSFQGADQSCNFSTIYPLASRQLQGSEQLEISDDCDAYITQSMAELGDINIYDIYENVCRSKHKTAHITQLARITAQQRSFFAWHHAAARLERTSVKDSKPGDSNTSENNNDREHTNGDDSRHVTDGATLVMGQDDRAYTVPINVQSSLRLSQRRYTPQVQPDGGESTGSFWHSWRDWLAWIWRGRLLPPAGDEDGKSPTLDPCVDKEVHTYLNSHRVQKALHANTSGQVPGLWQDCNEAIKYSVEDVMTSMLPLYPTLIQAGLKIVIYSGDVDGILPTLGTRRWVKSLGLKVASTWHPWTDSAGQPGGWAEMYENNTAIVTVRNAGHMVPYTQPRRAYDLFHCVVVDDKPTVGPVIVAASLH